jgi:hypothetical protein
MYTILCLTLFLLEFISLVSSENKMGSYEVFIVGGRSFICINKANALKLTPGEFHVLWFPILRKIYQIILFQCFHNQFPIQWVPGALSPGGKAAGA